MAWRPKEAGPKNLRELYHWAWQNFISAGVQIGDVGGEDPGHTHSHPTLTNRDAVDSHPISAVTDLQSTLDVKVSEGYGGIINQANTVIADLDGSWITLPADTASVANPVNVVQDLATNSISIDTEGVWLICMSGTLSHNEVNAGRVMGVRIHNVTKAISPYVLGVPTGRNTPGTAFSYTFLVDIDVTNVTDNFVVDVGGPGDTYTGVVVDEYTFDAVHVSAAGGSSGSSASLEARVAALEARQLNVVEREWVAESATLLERGAVITTDQTWTEIARLPVAPGTTVDCSIEITATRLNQPGSYRAQYATSAFDVLGTLLIKESVELFQLGNDQLSTRVITDGSDLVWQVRGKPGQEWKWSIVIFDREREDG